MVAPKEMVRVTETLWEVPATAKPGMLVPARVYATEELIRAMDDGVWDQVTNVAMLPGIVGAAYCMPDGHWGYGFPIGGVAAMDAEEGVISPGGIGFDINCGMRLLTTDLTWPEVEPHLDRLLDALFKRVPAGAGRSGLLRPSRKEFRQVLQEGARWCVEHGYGWPEDLERTEDGGCFEGADPDRVSDRAVERGLSQIGTLGSGNHYLELQVVHPENIHDAELARRFGITQPGQVVVMFHCGSRGFGHQVATDYLRVFLKAMPRYGLRFPDRELACAPFRSKEGQDYFAAMKCSANNAFANRQVILHRVREVFADVFGRDARDLGMHMVYDVAHNTAKLETHEVDGRPRELLVHRKGSTRAFPPGHPGLPPRYKDTGQPVIIGGSMETGSWVLSGVPTGTPTFFSTAHGSGRLMSRTQARKQFRANELVKQMAARGIRVRSVSKRGLAEEAGAAYKDIDAVVEAVDRAGLSHRVVRLVPVANIKG